MTLPDERYRAVTHAERFLSRLAGGYYARVPKAVREEARALLRHYPTDWDMDRAAAQAPDIFQKQMEAVYRLLKQYEQDKT